jgi:organic hydroperoxide reductase OsmC/OhrA
MGSIEAHWRTRVSHLYTAQTIWQREQQAFTDKLYSRRHRLRFDGGLDIAGSSSPLVVPVPMSDPQALDPEEALVSAVSSCHMLWFLSIAAKRRFIVDSYHDHAEGTMVPNERKKLWLAHIRLNPVAEFSGYTRPTREELVTMHHEAHDECFIANSVRSEITVFVPDDWA